MSAGDVVVATNPLERRISGSIPVVRRSLATALSGEMSLERLIDRYADSVVPIEFSLEEIYRPRPSFNGGAYVRRLMTLADAVRTMAAFAHQPYGCYISNFNSNALDRMIALAIPDEIRRPDGPKPKMALFIGSDVSGSHWHYDPTDNVILVLDGSKEIYLKPPGSLRPHQIASACPNFAARADVPHHESPIILEAGDSLFLPSGWWRMVRNRGSCVSLSVIYPTEFFRRHGWSCLRIKLSRVLAGLRSETRRNPRPPAAARTGSAPHRAVGAHAAASRCQG